MSTVLITGASRGIGAQCALSFAKAGYDVALNYCRSEAKALALVKEIEALGVKAFAVQADVADSAQVKGMFDAVRMELGAVDVLVNNAPPLFKGIDECTYDEFMHAQAVGVAAPFYLAKLFKDHFGEGASIINISSSRDRMSQPQSESYTAAKGGIAALTHGLAASLAGKVRVNSISPGWIDTSYKTYDGPDATQHFAGRVGNPLDIANMVLFLASDKAGFITGENICIDGGMTRNMIYTGDFGWKLEN